jgi:ankyrin repeat protein
MADGHQRYRNSYFRVSIGSACVNHDNFHGVIGESQQLTTGCSGKIGPRTRLAPLLAAVILALIGCTESPQNQLLSAVVDRDLEGVARLLREHSQLDINYRTPRTGQSALSNAVSTGDAQLVRMLLRHGANPSLGSYEQQTPLILAAHHGYVEIVQLLIAAGADVNTSEERYGFTALTSAAKEGHGYIVGLLLAAGADSHALTKDGRTASQLASQYNRQDVIRILQRYDNGQRKDSDVSPGNS